ncbi:SURF1-like protein [Aliidongia dinghuensis]|uniref:SURF1-like protein n=1 Tax=Aliidongia dinghuensis TaxID=1867774 RepID=A0A8J2YSW2_9PROT|nr:SURF1 family protein [Aliidongia dinghuensis]GGF16351.1 SURF1-like protein [Aliidongia dinghuensis]
MSTIQFLKTRFRFTFWPTVFTIPAILLTIGLGTWQVQRLAWKTALIADREAALSAPPAAIPDSGEGAQALDFHRVAGEGTFDNDKELYIGAFSTRDVEGYQVVTPFRLADGKIVLVNRGWVPEARKDPAKRPEGEIQGSTTLDGILRVPVVPKSIFSWLVPTPVNRPNENFWFYVDVPGMVAKVGLDPAQVLPFYIEAGPAKNPGGFPVGGQTRIALPNDHLQYAITWYSFAIILAAIYFIYHYRKPGPAPEGK